MDKIQIINAVLAGSAIVAGLYSRKLLAALAAWFWLAVVHTGLVLLAMGQAGDMTAPGLPLLPDVLPMVTQYLDTGFRMANVTFANTGLVAYFVATIGILFLLTLAAFLVSSVLSALAALFVPQKASA
jgi:hypothetical protein